MGELLVNKHRISNFEGNMDLFLKKKRKKCVFYSEDGTKFKANEVNKYFGISLINSFFLNKKLSMYLINVS